MTFAQHYEERVAQLGRFGVTDPPRHPPRRQSCPPRRPRAGVAPAPIAELTIPRLLDPGTSGDTEPMGEQVRIYGVRSAIPASCGQCVRAISKAHTRPKPQRVHGLGDGSGHSRYKFRTPITGGLSCIRRRCFCRISTSNSSMAGVRAGTKPSNERRANQQPGSRAYPSV
jgi:hypothetical protein